MKRIITLCLLSLIVTSILAIAPDWQKITGTQYSMVMITEVWFNNLTFTGSGDNMLGAFGPGGESDCRDVAVWDANGYWYMTIVGNTNGETISFKIYDADSDQVYDCAQTVTFEDNLLIGSPSVPYTLSVGTSNISGHVNLITTTPPVSNVTDVIISNGSSTTHPNASGDYLLPALPGVYTITFQMPGYNTVTTPNVVVYQNQTTAGVNATLIDWEPIGGTQYSMVVMADIHLGDELFSADGNNFAAAFGPGGDADCRSVAVWQEPNPPYWDGYWFFTIVGNTANEEITFKIYDNSASVVYECVESVTFVDNSTIGSPDTPFDMTVDLSIDQDIPLGNGWNWISFYVHPDLTAIEDVFASVTNSIYQVKSQTQSSTYYATLGTWVGDLTSIEDGEGYLVYMNQPEDAFSLHGVPIALDSPINLAANWNWVAYYPRSILTLDTALMSVISNVDQVKNQSQTAQYINPPGAWVGDLLAMEPGVGYKIKMDASDVLIYQGTEQMHPGQTEPPATDDAPAWQVISGTQYSMVVMAQVLNDGVNFDNSGDNMVAAFGPDGDDDCRAIATWQEGNPPSYDGFWYFTVVGNTLDEDICFKIYDSAVDSVYSCVETISFSDNATIGDPTNPYILTVDHTGAHGQPAIPQIALAQNTPNPFRAGSANRNGGTTIEFSIAQANTPASLIIYDIKGRIVRHLVHETLPAGKHSVQWNGRDDHAQAVASGVYFYQLKQAGQVKTQKAMLIK
jgi:hypothetical protein